MLQQQQCILFKIHKAYNTLCPAYNYSANLAKTKIINKGVIKLHIKKKVDEKKYNNTQKEKLLTQTKSHNGTVPLWLLQKLKHRGFVIRKKVD